MRRRTILHALQAALLAALPACADYPTRPELADPDMPEQLNDGWSVGSLGDHGIDAEHIALLETEIVSGDLEEITSLVIARHGKLVYEGYYGSERDRLRDLNSVTKSVASIVMGVAVQEGFVSGYDASLESLLPSYSDIFQSDQEKKRIRLHHVLSMTAGLDWNDKHPSDPTADDVRLRQSGDGIRFVLEKEVVAEPGRQFHYSGGASTLLSGIIYSATGRHADEFAKEYLFDQIGIQNYNWTHQADGLAETNDGVFLTARDMARLGQLYLNGGRWNGRQIVSNEWIEASTRPWIETDERGTSYGFQWWLRSLPGSVDNPGNENGIVFGSGYGGQKLYIVSELDLVVVFFGCAGTYECGLSDAIPQLVMSNYILPAVE